MKAEFITYLESIGIVGDYYQKADKVIRTYEEVFEIEIEDIFVSDFIDGNGARVHESMWMFVTGSLCEAKNFITQNDFDLTPIRNSIKYWNFNSQGDLLALNTQSRMSLKLTTKYDIIGILKATNNNCSKLLNVFKQYIKPNVVDG